MSSRLASLLSVSFFSLAPLAAQTTFTKANNTTALNQAASWSPAVVPTAADIAYWNGTYTSGTVSVGSGLSVSTLRIASPSTAITLNASTGPLTLGSGGIDLSAATQNLTINAPVVLAADQTWSVASGRTLTFASPLSPSVSGATPALTLSGSGTFSYNGATAATPFPGPLFASSGTLRVNQAAGNVTLNSTNFPGGSANTLTAITGTGGSRLTLDASGDAALTFASNSAGFTFVLKNGVVTYNAVSGGTDATNVRVEGGSFTVSSTAARYQLASANQTFQLVGGSVDVSRVTTFGFRVGGAGSATQAGAQNVVASQSGGSLLATFCSIGGTDTTAAKSPSYTLSGGTFTTTSLASTSLQIGADAAGLGSSAFNLGGGKLLVPGTISGGQAGARQIFAMSGGTLVASAINFTNLRSADVSTNGAFSPSGGILAPGDIGTPGRLAVTGAFSPGPASTLAIDLAGNSPATVFQQNGTHDQLIVSNGPVALSGTLSVSLLGNYTPLPSHTFTILNNTGTGAVLSGSFANAAFGDSVPVGDGTHGFTVTQSGNNVVLGNYHLLQPPRVTTPPAGVSAFLGGSATFSVAADGVTPIAFQWRKDGVAIPGANAASLTLSNLQDTDAGDYDVVLRNVDGGAVSASARLTVLYPPPTLNTSPASASVVAGSSVGFSVNAFGAALSYRWRKDGIDIPGANSATLLLPSAAFADAALYDVVVTNAFGSVTSAPARLAVAAPWSSPLVFLYNLDSAPPAANGAVTDSAGNTTGTLIGAPSPVSAAAPRANLGSAWDFATPGAFIRVANNALIRSLGDITQTRGLSFGFWARYNWTSNVDNYQRVLGLANCIDALTVDSSGKGLFEIRLGNGTNIPQITLRTPEVLDGTWHHVFVSVDFTATTGNVRLYVDGISTVTQSQPIQASFTGGTSNFILAARNTSSTSAANPLKGAMDQFAVFNRAVPAAEVAQLYANAAISNYAPLVSVAASAATVVSPATQTTLVATAVDDSQPAGSPLALSWTKVSGPGTVTFSAASSLVTSASFSALGSYVLRFTASDGALSTSADLSVNVVKNAAPVVYAGTPSPLVGPAPAPVSLSGAATDDGLPATAPLSYLWTQLSGPGAAVFANPAAASTTVSLPAGALGTYVFQLAASDGALTGTAVVVVQVAANLAPIVQAVSTKPVFAWSADGPNQTAVSALASDDGLPATPGVLSYAWLLVEGPGSATFSAPSGSATSVVVSAPGIYRVRVTVGDGALTGASDLWLRAADAAVAAPVPTSVTQFSAPPPPYEHPRVFFTDADHAALRAAALNDPVASAGRVALEGVVSSTLDNSAHALGTAFAQLKAGNTSFNTQSLTLAQSPAANSMVGTSGSGLYGTLAAASYLAWLNRDTGEIRLRELATAVATAARNHATWWPADRAAQPTPKDFNKDIYSDLGFCYDLLYDWMSEDQRASVRQLLAAQLAGRLTLGATEADHWLSTNWRTHHDHIIIAALAIEGETGHDPAALLTNRRALKTFLSRWGVGPEGFSREGPGYYGFGMHSASLALWALARRDENLLATTRFYESAQEMFYQMAPDGSGPMYGANDGVGWGNGNGNTALYPILKAAYPDDPFIDWVTRQALSPANSVIAASQPLIMAIWGRAPLASTTSFAAVTAAQPRPLHLFSAQRGLGVARSDWSDSALQVDFENRFDAFSLGHNHALRNHFTLYALGREWIGGQGYHYIANDMKSTVLIDGLGQSSASLQALAAAGKPAIISWPPMPGKFLENLDHPVLSLFAGDAKPAYDYSWAGQDYTDPAKIPAGSVATPWRWRDLAYPGYVFTPPVTGDNNWPDAFIRAEAAPFNPVQRAFRSVLLLRGSRPYVLVIDDIQKDSAPRTYTWSANCVTNRGLLDMTLQAGATATDAIFYHANTDASSGPRLLVRVLEGKGVVSGPISLDATPLDFGEGPTEARRIQISRTGVVAPDFKVLLYPHQSGESLPTTSYDSSTGLLSVATPGGPTDLFRLVVQPDGRTRVAEFTRAGTSAPRLSLPADIVVQNDFGPAAVQYSVTATDAGGQPLVPKMNPAPGALFPLGTTPVTVSVSDSAGNVATGVFKVTVQSRWTLANIGNQPALPGAAAPGSIGGSFTLAGTGGTTGTTGDIAAGSAEGFTCLSLPWSGDGIFTARVASLSASDSGAKAGIMFRESAAARARNSVMFMSAAGAAVFQNQIATGGAVTASTSSARGIPEWIRLVRSGDTFTGFWSDDGVTWTLQGTATLNSMRGSSLLVGLVVAPRTGGQIASAVLDNVSFHTPLEAWRQAAFGTSAGAGNAADGADPDGDGFPNLIEYAVGTSPTSAAVHPNSPDVRITNIGPARLELVFGRARADLIYEVQASSDLLDWTTLATNPGAVGQIVAVADATELGPANPSRFMRLRVVASQ